VLGRNSGGGKENMYVRGVRGRESRKATLASVILS
jgi:hypothetical protein